MSNLGNKAIMSKNIQYYMDKYQKTRNDLCTALGVKYTTLTDWIKGNTYPRIDKIELMANYFGVNKSDLIEDKSNDTNPDILELTPKEAAHIENYRCLDDLDRARIDERMDVMLEDEKYHKKDITIAG